MRMPGPGGRWRSCRIRERDRSWGRPRPACSESREPSVRAARGWTGGPVEIFGGCDRSKLSTSRFVWYLGGAHGWHRRESGRQGLGEHKRRGLCERDAIRFQHTPRIRGARLRALCFQRVGAENASDESAFRRTGHGLLGHGRKRKRAVQRPAAAPASAGCCYVAALRAEAPLLLLIVVEFTRILAILHGSKFMNAAMVVAAGRADSGRRTFWAGLR